MPALRSDYDLVFEPPGEDPLGLMLYRRPRTGRSAGLSPYRMSGSLIAEADASQQHWVRQDEDDWSAGSFYSRRIVPNGHAWTENGDASLPGLFIPDGLLTEFSLAGYSGLITSIKASADYQGDLYFAGGRFVFRINGGTSAPGLAIDLGPGANVLSMAVFNGSLYLGGSNINLWRLTGSTWTEASFGRRYLDVVHWRVQDVGTWRLVGSNSANGVNYVSGDPFVEANWTPNPLGLSSIQIGNNETDITAIIAAPRHVYFVKSDTGVHDLNAQGDAPTLTPYWRHSHTVEGQTPALIHEGYLYVPTRQGLDRVDIRDEGRKQDDPGWCQPGYGLPNETPVRGEVTALTAVAGWVVASVYNGTDSYICWGKDRAKIGIEGKGPMAWYTKTHIPGERVSHLRPSSPNGVPRLWIATTGAAGTALRWQSLPKGGNPIQEYLWGGDHRFARSCVLVTSSDIWGNAAARKTMRRLGVTTENLSDDAYFGIDLALDSTGSGAWTEQQVVRTSPYESFMTTNETGYRTVMRVRGTGRPNVPPILRGLVPRADLYVEQDELRVYQVLLGDGVTLRSGTFDARDQQDVFDRLRYLAEAGHMTMRDELGAELEVIVQPAMPWESVESPTAEQHQQRIASLTVSVIDRTFYWDSAAEWDAGKVWS